MREGSQAEPLLTRGKAEALLTRGLLLSARLAIFQTINKLKPGPNVVYGADFYVNQTGIESDFANVIVGKVSGYARRFFWPRNPEHSVPGELSGKIRKLFFQSSL